MSMRDRVFHLTLSGSSGVLDTKVVTVAPEDDDTLAVKRALLDLIDDIGFSAMATPSA